MPFSEINADQLARHVTERDKHFKRNYLIHAIEGGLYMGGIAFVAPGTVLPALMQNLGAASWLIALAPSLLLIGFMAPGVFVAPWVESLPRMKPFVMWAGFLQRIPYLFVGLALFWAGSPAPAWCLPMVVALPLIAGLFGGVNVPAWQEFVARTVPENKRSSLWAIRFLIHAVIGVGAGLIVERVLGDAPGMREYGILHLFLFGFIFTSFVVFVGAREAELPPKRAKADSPLELLRSIPAMLKSEVIFRQFLFTKFAFQLVFFVIPFMGIHALDVMGEREGFLGILLAWQMGGMIAGNLLAGRIGDKVGGKAALLTGHVILLIMCLSIPMLHSKAGFIAMFVLFGFGISFTNVGGPTMDMEIVPERRRVSALAVIGWANLSGILVASVCAGMLRDAGYSFNVLAALAAGGIGLATLLLWRVPEPRAR